MSRAYRSLDADQDIRTIAYEIGVASGLPATANRVIDELLECCMELAELSSVSQLGTSLPEVGDGVRAYTHKRWVILFRYVVDGIFVIRIADGSQDYLKWRLE